ncbi:hypothetical protein GGX14DRAFT_405827 [Mycena pura]|uniref:Uncharacterized protein n=1 Tax=Mycena pura TaxID=153505 RepID=A0AAD6UVM0_9AGAR|nr:hypothetical protein GGX14DRAFT_405827 [Mycena pura]
MSGSRDSGRYGPIKVPISAIRLARATGHHFQHNAISSSSLAAAAAAERKVILHCFYHNILHVGGTPVNVVSVDGGSEHRAGKLAKTCRPKISPRKRLLTSSRLLYDLWHVPVVFRRAATVETTAVVWPSTVQTTETGRVPIKRRDGCALRARVCRSEGEAAWTHGAPCARQAMPGPLGRLFSKRRMEEGLPEGDEDCYGCAGGCVRRRGREQSVQGRHGACGRKGCAAVRRVWRVRRSSAMAVPGRGNPGGCSTCENYTWDADVVGDDDCRANAVTGACPKSARSSATTSKTVRETWAPMPAIDVSTLNVDLDDELSPAGDVDARAQPSLPKRDPDVSWRISRETARTGSLSSLSTPCLPAPPLAPRTLLCAPARSRWPLWVRDWPYPYRTGASPLVAQYGYGTAKYSRIYGPHTYAEEEEDGLNRRGPYNLSADCFYWSAHPNVNTPRSRCRGMHPVHKGQQKGGMREQHSLFPHVKIVSKPLSQDTTHKCQKVGSPSGHQRSLHSGHYRSHLWEDHIKVAADWPRTGRGLGWYDIALRRNGYYLILSSLDIVEKGLKELIKAALEEDSDDDDKPVDLGNAPGNAPPADVLPLASMDNSCAAARGVAEASGSGGAGRRHWQARVSDHGRCTGQRRRRASKPTPRMLPHRTGGGAAQGSPVLQRSSVVAARRRQQASKASVCADALPCEHTRAALQRSCGDGGNVERWCSTAVLQRGSAVAARRREGESKARARCPVSMHRQRVARRCNAAAAAGDSTAGGIVRQLTPRTLPQARCTGNGRRKRAPAVPRCSASMQGPPRAALPRELDIGQSETARVHTMCYFPIHRPEHFKRQA